MGALAITALQLLAPGLLGGSVGVVLGILQSPLAGPVATLAKAAAEGKHLSDDEKEFIKQYNNPEGMEKTDKDYFSIHGRWH